MTTDIAREIGGYLELEHFTGSEYHPGALALNCARACLAYLIEARDIKELWVPEFICASIDDTVSASGTRLRKYPILPDLEPDLGKIDLGDTSYLYLVDYYGQLSQERVRALGEWAHGRIITDEVMAFFRRPVEGMDTIYSCRKFFGVSDGAYLFTSAHIKRQLQTDASHGRMGFVLGRFEGPANDFYPQAAANNALFAHEPIRLMSPLTHNLLRAVNYGRVARRREENCAYLSRRLAPLNELDPVTQRGAFMYPLLIKDGQRLRKELQARGVYVSTLWPHAVGCAGVAGRYARDILPLPVDQRYGRDDMAYVCDLVEGLVGCLRSRDS